MRAIVVGGTKGIGKAICDRLAKDDHEIVSMARNNADVRLNLRDDTFGIQRAVFEARDKLDGVDWLVIASGMGAYLGPFEMDPTRVSDLFQVNVLGPIQVYRTALRDLLRSRGKVLFLGSTVATRGARGLSIYGATKGAIDAFVKSEARGLAKHHVAMNVLAPGWVETPMTEEIKPALKEAIVRAIPMRRMAFSEEVAEMAVRILGAPHYATGTVYEFAGGM